MEVTRTRRWEAVGIEHSSREYRLPRLPAIIYNKRGKKKELWSLILDNVSSKRSIIYGSRRNEACLREHDIQYPRSSLMSLFPAITNWHA